MITTAFISSQEHGAGTHSQACRSLRILLVDRCAPTSQTLVWAIESLGDTVMRCDPDAALARALEFKPHVIIADLTVPGTDAGKWCADLQAVKEISNAKIIAQGLYGTVDLAPGDVSSRFDLHLKKPIDLAILREMLSLLRTSAKTVS